MNQMFGAPLQPAGLHECLVSARILVYVRPEYGGPEGGQGQGVSAAPPRCRDRDVACLCMTLRMECACPCRRRGARRAEAAVLERTDQTLKDGLARIRDREDTATLTVQETALERISVTEQHPALCRELRHRPRENSPCARRPAADLHNPWPGRARGSTTGPRRQNPRSRYGSKIMFTRIIITAAAAAAAAGRQVPPRSRRHAAVVRRQRHSVCAGRRGRDDQPHRPVADDHVPDYHGRRCRDGHRGRELHGDHHRGRLRVHADPRVGRHPAEPRRIPTDNHPQLGPVRHRDRQSPGTYTFSGGTPLTLADTSTTPESLTYMENWALAIPAGQLPGTYTEGFTYLALANS